MNNHLPLVGRSERFIATAYERDPGGGQCAQSPTRKFFAALGIYRPPHKGEVMRDVYNFAFPAASFAGSAFNPDCVMITL